MYHLNHLIGDKDVERDLEAAVIETDAITVHKPWSYFGPVMAIKLVKFNKQTYRGRVEWKPDRIEYPGAKPIPGMIVVNLFHTEYERQPTGKTYDRICKAMALLAAKKLQHV